MLKHLNINKLGKPARTNNFLKESLEREREICENEQTLVGNCAEAIFKNGILRLIQK